MTAFSIMYLNLETLENKLDVFNIILGNRGGGKTYTCLRDCIKNGKKFIYLRRTQKEIQRIAKKKVDVSLSPFEPLNKDYPDWNLEVEPLDDDIYAVTNGLEDEKKSVGLMCPLSTFASMRGFSAPDVEVIIFDEFNPELHVRGIKNEDDAFFNMYETVNRNRELQGEKPVQVFLLGNTNNIAIPILETLGLIEVIEGMQRKGKKFYNNRNRNLFLMLMEDSDYIEKKSKTALYKLTAGTEFYEMALENKFAYNDFSDIEVKNLNEYRLEFTCNDFAVWKHKSRFEFYVTKNTTGRIDYESTEAEAMALRNRMRYLYNAYLGRKIIYQNYRVKKSFTNYV